MPLRFTESTKWENQWFRKLKPQAKLVYLFLVDNCDLAGFYELDFEAMAFKTSLKQQQIEQSIDQLKSKFERNDPWIWLTDFMKQQKNYPLKQNNPAHRNIIKSITEHANIFPDSLAYVQEIQTNDTQNTKKVSGILQEHERGTEGATKELDSSTGKDKEDGKGQDLGKDANEEEEKKEQTKQKMQEYEIRKDGIQYYKGTDAPHFGLNHK
ncbi:MAG: hypothetical protein IIA45_04375 [Bacteroidetes bacterium]|nr:hypothetical protein [Bacteroidota bacterium]